MLQKKYRLTKRKQFNYIYRRGRSFSSDTVSLVFSFCKMKNVKIGFSASKKIGGSVVRHRALRLMREAIKPLIANMTENHNYIFIAKEGITKKTVQQINKDIVYLLKRAALITPPKHTPEIQAKAQEAPNSVANAKITTTPELKGGGNVQ